MNEQALFCDGTGAYVIPPQPDANEAITLRFRTAKDDVDAVRLLTRDAKYDLQKVYTKGEFDFYEVNWRMGEDTFRYCFEIQKGEEICYYNRYGVTNEIIGYYAFSIAPGFATPDWAKGAVKLLTFDVADEETFRCLAACKKAIRKGGLGPCAANGANEEAVKLFLEDKIGFLDIGRLVEAVVDSDSFGGERLGIESAEEEVRKASEKTLQK